MRRVGYPNLERAGRLGNQLWQVAATLGFARERGVDPIFPEDWSYRPYLSVPDEWFGDERALARSVSAVSLSDLPPAQAPYLQQWRFIEPVMDEVMEAFRPSPLAIDIMVDHLASSGQGYLIVLGKAITLHVRRGDNTNPETHPVGSWPLVTMDYYRDALALLDPDAEATVVVFSDDPHWTADHLSDIVGPRNGWVVHGGPTRSPDYEPDAYAADRPMDWIDLQLMASFTGGAVIANSTYSLWGALLEPRPTTYPDNWVGWRNAASLPPVGTMVPPGWHCIPNPVDPIHLTAPG